MMTSSVIDAMLSITRMSEYYQIADNAPFTFNAIERETELFNCRVLMEQLVDRR